MRLTDHDFARLLAAGFTPLRFGALWRDPSTDEPLTPDRALARVAADAARTTERR